MCSRTLEMVLQALICDSNHSLVTGVIELNWGPRVRIFNKLLGGGASASLCVTL